MKKLIAALAAVAFVAEMRAHQAGDYTTAFGERKQLGKWKALAE